MELNTSMSNPVFRYNNIPQAFVFYYQGSEDGKDTFLAEPNLESNFNGNNINQIQLWMRKSLIPRLRIVVDVSVPEIVEVTEVLFPEYVGMVSHHANVTRSVEPIIVGLLIWLMFKDKDFGMSDTLSRLISFCHRGEVIETLRGRKEIYAL